MPLVNILILISAAISTHVAFTPPAARSKIGEEKTAKAQSWPIMLADHLTLWHVHQAGVTLVFLAEACAVYSFANPQTDFAFAFHAVTGRSQDLEPRLYTSAYWVLGIVMTFLGTAIRKRCYLELGRLFTFNLSILENHKLVTTGPYSIVRHPAYTGGFLASWGLTLAAWCPGTWWAEARVIDTVVGKAVALIWVIFVVQAMIVYARAATEDAVLRKEFGKEWEIYASKVQYRYIPGIL
ncbi:hypothetical protein BC834DRAFT_826867 [Gloeopeniophorella convolvens]|nr:hypothetical protein BC834DRAFT_826867 [Gloeopeniophorella convolvens]